MLLYVTHLKQKFAPVKRILFLSILAAVVACACERWVEPTLNLSGRSALALDSIAQTPLQLAQLASLPSRQQLDSLLVWTVLLKNYAEKAALVYAREATRLATETNRDNYQAMGRYYLALLEGRQQLFLEGLADPLTNARISNRLWKQTTNYYWQANTAQLLGDIFYRQEVNDSANYYFGQALLILELEPEKSARYHSLKGSIFHGQGMVFAEEKDPAAAEKLYQQAGVEYQLAGDNRALSMLQQGLASLKISQGELDSADAILKASLANATNQDDPYTMNLAYQKLGDTALKKYRKGKLLEDFSASETYFRKSLAIQKDNFYYTYDRLAVLMQSRASRDDSRPDYVDSALVYYSLALEKAREEGALVYFRALTKNISRLCDWLTTQGRDCNELLGTSASDYLFANYSGVVDTITTDLAAANTNLLAFERQQQEANSRERIRNLWLFSGGGLLVATLIFLLLFQRQKQRRLEARMAALRAQINPHFFSNSLNAIESLINLGQPKAASKYLIHFSRLTRRILSSSMKATTSLAGELETTRHFLALEQLRFKDKMHYEIEVAPGINPDEIEVPSLLFQPYLENAIWHGIKPKPEPGLLQIKIEPAGKELLCTITDDGIGRAAAQILRAQSLLQQESVGMKITGNRLRGFGGGTVVVTDLYDENGQASGTRVQLRLPWKKYQP